jgi:hypothetical protein
MSMLFSEDVAVWSGIAAAACGMGTSKGDGSANQKKRRAILLSHSQHGSLSV